MYSMLVVDDEKFVVQGIAKGIEWDEVGIEDIHMANSADQAVKIFEANSIDVMICDIEMPGRNGMQLLEWVKASYPATEVILLTAHSNFSYAQKAVQLGGFDYILKPVDNDFLKQTVANALQKVKAGKEFLAYSQTYKKYHKLWEAQLPILIERFWQDVLSHRISLTQKEIETASVLYGLPVHPSGSFFSVLINVEQWEEYMDVRDQEIMEFGLRNIAHEIILQGHSGAVIKDHSGNNLVLLYLQDQQVDLDKIKSCCRQFIQACNEHLQCSLSCYIGEPNPIDRLSNTYELLLAMVRKNVNRFNSVLFINEYMEDFCTIAPVPPFMEWSILVESGKKEELFKRMEEYFYEMKRVDIIAESIETVYFGVIHMAYTILHKNELSVYEAFQEKDIHEGAAGVKSCSQLADWAKRVLESVMDYLDSKGRNSSAVTEKVKQYVQERLYEEFTREDIAAFVYLNPDYLTRVFKKETGLSLSDYIVKTKMEKAKKLLAQSNEKVSDIAERLGYSSFSYFAKLFKKVVGLGPQEYRKKFQDVIG